MIETIEFNGDVYPKFQSTGNAARFAIPFATEICKGIGVDIGCNKEDWKFPGATCIDISLCDCDAMNLPFKDKELDYVFSSHCLEHLENWVEAIEHWSDKLKSGGALFLYLPNMDYQKYWRGWNNRKHIHYLTPEIVGAYFEDRKQNWSYVFVTDGIDANCSFYVIACKK